MITVADPAPSETLPNDPPANDPPPASNESAHLPEPDRNADTPSSASHATASEINRPTAARPQSTGTSGLLAGRVQNVSGEWRLDTQVELSDSSDSFEGQKLHYEMTLKQDGDHVSGVGTRPVETKQDLVREPKRL